MKKSDINERKSKDARVEQPKIRKITIKTAVRAAGQSHNRYSGGS